MRQRPNYGFAPEPVPRYTGFAIALHWLMAIAIIGMLGVGLWMTELKTSPIKIEVYTWHKWIGLTVLGLAALRLVWRAYNPPPLDGMRTSGCYAQGLLRLLSGTSLLMFAMPLSGWLQNSAAGFPLTWFGLFKVPGLIGRDKEAFAFWQQTHEVLAWTLMALVVLHVAAALKHHFLDRDDTLTRILPGKRG